MNLYIREDEILSSYKKIIEKKTKESKLVFLKEIYPNLNLGEKTSLCPIGSDGLTTLTLENKNGSNVFRELYRTLNQTEYLNQDCPRFKPKKFKIVTKGEGENTRIICIPSLRDQIVLKFLFDKLLSYKILEENYFKNNSVRAIITNIKKELENGYCKIIRTDIKKFFDNINADRLLQMLSNHDNSLIDKKSINLIYKFIKNNKTSNFYSGIPTGLSISSFLSEFYIKGINDIFISPDYKYYRYADDILIIIKSDNIDPQNILSKLDNKLNELDLTRSIEKTEIYKTDENFNYLGVCFEKKKLIIETKKSENWLDKINLSIKKNFMNYEILKIIDNKYIKPSNQEIILRTKKNNILFKHLDYINKLNNE